MLKHLLPPCKVLLLLLQLHFPGSQLRCPCCCRRWAAKAVGACRSLLQLKLLLQGCQAGRVLSHSLQQHQDKA
jgi:hypothetical protein